MAQKRTGLGRGIGALIPGAPTTGERPVDVFFPSAPRQQTWYQSPGRLLPPSHRPQFVPNPQQPRKEFHQEELDELIHSVTEFGVLQPIVVRPLASPEGSVQYELIMGERRLRAATAAGLATIPAVVRETEDDAMLRDALLENLHRANLNALEEASAYQQLLSDFGITQDELATKLGRSRPQVTNTLRLLRLPADVQKKVAAGVLSAGHARALLAMPDATGMSALANKIVQQSLTVRQAEEQAGLAKASTPGGKKVRGGRRNEGSMRLLSAWPIVSTHAFTSTLSKTKGRCRLISPLSRTSTGFWVS
jgi:ParB family chromosome partitioning protein